MSAGAALRAVFRLEGERTVALARLGREPGAEVALEGIDAQLGAALEALADLGVAYPLHDVARRHRLGQDDYVVAQLALLRWHGVEAVGALTQVLGAPDDAVRLSHAILMVRPGRDDWQAAGAQIAALPVFTERLVELVGAGDDPRLVPTQATRELLGLS